MDIRKELEIREIVVKLNYYARQFGIPKSIRANEIERKILVEPDNRFTDAEWAAFRAEIRRIIEEVVEEYDD